MCCYAMWHYAIGYESFTPSSENCHCKKPLPNANQWTKCDQNVQVKIVSPSKKLMTLQKSHSGCFPLQLVNYINKGSNVYIANTLWFKSVIFLCFQYSNSIFPCIISVTTNWTEQICYIATELWGQLIKTITNLYTTSFTCLSKCHYSVFRVSQASEDRL